MRIFLDKFAWISGFSGLMLTLARRLQPRGAHRPGGQMTIVAGALLQRVGRLPAAESLAIGVFVLVVVLPPRFWAVVRGILLMAHEGAHAIIGSGEGGRVTKVELKANGEGLTEVAGGRAGSLSFPLAGYLGPSAFGLIAAALITQGLAVLVLWIAVALLAVLVFSVRNVFGVVLVIATGYVLLAVARSGLARAETVTAYGLAWLLLWSGVRNVLGRNVGAKDAEALRGLTGLPEVLWFLVWLAGTVAALVYGWRMLV